MIDFKKTQLFLKKYLLIIVFIFLYSWKPFNLGFYSDDWGYLVSIDNTVNYAPFSLNRLNFFKNVFLNRPGQIPFFYITSSLFRDNPMLWQAFSAFLMFFSAIIFKKTILQFLRLVKSKNYFIADITASFWLTIPWMLGITSWIVCTPAILSTALFSLSFYFILISWNKSKNYYLISALLLTASYSLYEAFFFQYLVFIAFGLILKLQNKIRWRSILTPLIYLSISQILILIWNRYAVTSDTPTKNFYPLWKNMFINYVINLPQNLLNSAIEFQGYIKFILLIFIIITAITILINLFIHKRLKITIIYFFLILSAITGYLISIWVYSITGYGIFSLGPLSRTTLSVSFWLIYIFTILLIFNLSVLNKFLKKTTYILILNLLMIFFISTFLRTMDWSKAWKIQQTILSQAPIEKLSKTEKDATVVYITPNTINEAFIFLAGYDLNNALINRYPEIGNQLNLAPHIPKTKGISSSKAYSSTISWDGDNVYYNNGPYSKTKNVYIWDYYNKTFNKIEKPFLLDDREIKPFIRNNN